MKNIISMCLAITLGWLTLASYASDFESLISDLNGKSYSAKRKAVYTAMEVEDDRLLPILKAMSVGDLYSRKSDDRLVIGKDTDSGVEITDVIDGGTIGVVNKNALEKVRINNSVRGALRTAIASIQLGSKDPDLRIQSARDLIKSPDHSLRDIVLEAAETEESTAVKKEMYVALGMIDIYGDDPQRRQQAVEYLADSYFPESVAALENVAKRGDDGRYVEENTALAKSAEKALEKVNSRLSLMSFFENLFFGVSLGSVLLLAAIGLAITFGVMGVINMAHGEMIMLGAYTTFAIQQLFPNWMNVSVLVAIPAAFLVSGSVGVVIERTVIRHLYGRPLETLLATFGISLFLQQLVRTYNSNNVPVVTPDWMSGLYQVNGALSFTYNRLYIILFSLVVLASLALLLRKTLLGLQMRAVTQNRAMANSMGIRSSWVDALTFGLGSGIAGIAGVALSQVTNVGPNMGQGFIIDSFMVVVFGGVGNLLGTFFAAMSLGVVTKFMEPFSGAVLGKIFMLVFIILFIQWRPRGLFALKGRFVED